MSGNRFCKFAYLKALRGMPMRPQFVLRVLADYADEYGRKAHPGIARLAADCDMPESTVRKHVKWLEANGYLVQTRAGHGEARFATEYSLALPSQPLTSERLGEEPTAHCEEPTAHCEWANRSPVSSQPLTSERPSDPLPDPSTSHQRTSDPDDGPDWGEPEPRQEEDPGWGTPTNAPKRAPGSDLVQANKIGAQEQCCQAPGCTEAVLPTGGRWCIQHLGLAHRTKERVA